MTRPDDTIAAVATPVGSGGIGIVKISGPRARGIAKRLFRASRGSGEPAPHRLRHGFIVDPETRESLDEVLVSYMAAPRSYTGEDVVEINCHSGPAALRRILDLVLSSGARMAEPGEFTRRAFLSGRIDLVRAEAVAELVAAESEKALALAAAQIKGALSKELADARGVIFGVLTELEASIDFSDDDIEPGEPGDLAASLREAGEKLERLLSTFEAARVFREGYTVVIAGRPNVGKSSLLNAFLGRDRAIVTEVPGTTRDVIEEVVEMDTVPVRLVDTAGIAEPGGPVDREGVRRALAAAGKADLVLWLLDGSEGLREDDFTVKEEIAGFPRLAVVNKADLPPALAPEEFTRRLGEEVMLVSAKEGTGLDGLRGAVTQRALHDSPEPREAEFAVNARHHRELSLARDALARAVEGLARGLGPELVALEVKEGLRPLDRVLGLSLEGDVLDMIFSRFCVGK